VTTIKKQHRQQRRRQRQRNGDAISGVYDVTDYGNCIRNDNDNEVNCTCNDVDDFDVDEVYA